MKKLILLGLLALTMIIVSIKFAGANESEKDITIDDIIAENDLAEYDVFASELEQIPQQIVASFVRDGWRFILDLEHDYVTSDGQRILSSGVTDYASKTIALRSPSAVLHEFGHYVDYCLDFPREHTELFETEAKCIASLLSNNAMRNSREYFAESFAWFTRNINDSEKLNELKDKAPNTFKYLQSLSHNDWIQ